MCSIKSSNSIIRFVTSFLFLSVLFAFGHTSHAKQPINIEVNGSKQELEPAPILEKDSVLIPLRSVSNLLGYKVEWHQEQKTAILVGLENRVTLNTTNNKAFKNEVPVEKKVAIKMVNNQIFVPIRFISETIGDQVKWDQNTRTVSIQIKHIFIKTKQGDSEYWINKVNGDLYVVKALSLPKKIGSIGLSVPAKYHQEFLISAEAKQTPKGNVLLTVHNNYGEPHLNNEIFSVYLKDNKIIKHTKAYYYNRWVQNVQFNKDMVILTDGKKAYFYDDRTATLAKTHDLAVLGGEDENYFIEGIGENYILIRPNQTGHLTLYNFKTNEKIKLYKELFKDNPMELEYAEMNDTPYRGDALHFLGEKNGSLHFKNNSIFNKDDKTYQYKVQ